MGVGLITEYSWSSLLIRVHGERSFLCFLSGQPCPFIHPLPKLDRVHAGGPGAQLHHWQAIFLDEVVHRGSMNTEQASNLIDGQQLRDGKSGLMLVYTFGHFSDCLSKCVQMCSHRRSR